MLPESGPCFLIGSTPEQAARLEAHFELLTRWNRALNLTRIRDRAEAIERHYNESLFVARHLPSGPLRIVDIGSGAGFPGFPVAIVRPECSVTLIESHQRKAVFLREASRKFPNIQVVCGRAEESGETFDWAVSRAVSYADLRETPGAAGRACCVADRRGRVPGCLGVRMGSADSVACIGAAISSVGSLFHVKRFW